MFVDSSSHNMFPFLNSFYAVYLSAIIDYIAQGIKSMNVKLIFLGVNLG
jgi:hypothetical protein